MLKEIHFRQFRKAQRTSRVGLVNRTAEAEEIHRPLVIALPRPAATRTQPSEGLARAKAKGVSSSLVDDEKQHTHRPIELKAGDKGGNMANKVRSKEEVSKTQRKRAKAGQPHIPKQNWAKKNQQSPGAKTSGKRVRFLDEEIMSSHEPSADHLSESSDDSFTDPPSGVEQIQVQRPIAGQHSVHGEGQASGIHSPVSSLSISDESCIDVGNVALEAEVHQGGEENVWDDAAFRIPTSPSSTTSEQDSNIDFDGNVSEQTRFYGQQARSPLGNVEDPPLRKRPGESSPHPIFVLRPGSQSSIGDKQHSRVNNIALSTSQNSKRKQRFTIPPKGESTKK
ncbi:uncharacterized protein KY384_005307 [Bacidia gigantensis]|uniref:uncharacterized protein n=1 Tax=Bacidia gigantensis TaxID=2732470 RepID=UPI001D046B91|nr:uncharacterized protein KY384_005307 [Bacidia gigantensis]KAG8529826.1 hypothetical protein KY384_005307 [Bacidia gigantensis]